MAFCHFTHFESERTCEKLLTFCWRVVVGCRGVWSDSVSGGTQRLEDGSPPSAGQLQERRLETPSKTTARRSDVMLCYCVDVFTDSLHAKCSLLYSRVWMGGWWDGWCFTIFIYRFYWFFYINAIVLTMLSASIYGFLLFWQPATSHL